MKCSSICGRDKNIKFDYYETPSWAVGELLITEEFKGTILEPCSGNGAISKVLEKHNFTVVSSDIRVDDDVYGEKGINMFDIKEKYNNIITNPPYSLAQQIIEKSLEITDRKVAMILKLSFLESIKRYPMFKSTPFKQLYVFSKRVQMYPGGQVVKKENGPIAFGWFIWEHGYTGRPFIDWIKP